MFYVLDKEKNVVETDDMEAWAAFFEDAESRRVALTELANGWVVSTVFLGVPHCGGTFETMVFQGEYSKDHDMERYETWDQAVKGHERMVEKWKSIRCVTRP